MALPWEYVVPGAAALLATVFAVSAFGKFRDPRAFAEALEPLRLVPRRLLLPVAVGVPAAETVVVAAFGGYAVGVESAAGLAFAGALALLGVFTAVVVFSLRRRPSARCHCFGRTGAAYAPRHVVRNAGLGAAAVLGVLGAASAGVPEPAGVAVAVLAGAVAGVLVTAMDDVVELFA
ncbi:MULTISPECIES: MauE/DoxX family redox-associated membrane protein [unclassified Nocardiopsis]|uniref:MauE/DoxX family redox-associated membrane protein n=1 Tax=unclassified Nocardiopsis TaxID=2649073 RepID=UPI001356F1F0|nr:MULTISPECIES: MauE/DoxX family redox-associated membrane protein [unclassified Nocardiopsis]